MKKLIVAMFMLFATTTYAGGWTREDTYRELAWTALLIVDYGQTLYIVENNHGYRESNPILSEYPTRGQVNTYILSCAIIHPIISCLLPPKSDKWKWINRENFQYVSIGVEVGAVANNIGAGVGISF